MNVQRFEELKRVLAKVPQREFNISDWNHCACGHATRDEWFQRQGFTTCNSFGEAAAFFGITYTDATRLFAGQTGYLVRPRDVIEHIDAFLLRPTVEAGATEADHARRQAIVDDLLAKANRAAQKVRQVATALVAVLLI